MQPIFATVCRMIGATGLWRSSYTRSGNSVITNWMSRSPYKTLRFNADGKTAQYPANSNIFPLTNFGAGAVNSDLVSGNSVVNSASGVAQGSGVFVPDIGSTPSVLYTSGRAIGSIVFPTVGSGSALTMGLMVKVQSNALDGGSVLSLRGTFSNNTIDFTVHLDSASGKWQPRVTWSNGATTEQIDNSADTSFNGKKDLIDGKWAQICVTLTSSQATLYVNGAQAAVLNTTIALSDAINFAQLVVGARATGVTPNNNAKCDAAWVFLIRQQMSRKWISDMHHSTTRCSDLTLSGDINVAETPSMWDRQRKGIASNTSGSVGLSVMGNEECGSFGAEVVEGLGFSVMADIVSATTTGAVEGTSVFDMFTNEAAGGGGGGGPGTGTTISAPSYGSVQIVYVGGVPNIKATWGVETSAGQYATLNSSLVPLTGGSGNVIAVFPDGVTPMTIYINGKEKYKYTGTYASNRTQVNASITPEWRSASTTLNSGGLLLSQYSGTTGALVFVPKSMSAGEANRLFRASRGAYGLRHRFSRTTPRRYYQKASQLRVA